MAWETIMLKDWAEFVDFAQRSDVGSSLRATYLHRGQSDASWRLQSSLERLITGLLPHGISEQAVLRIEGKLQEFFGERARLHLAPHLLPAKDDLAGWSQIMQHYGAPTRMIDWTSSPYVAAYFAVVDDWDRPGAIWSFHAYSVENWAKTTVRTGLGNDIPPLILPVPPFGGLDRTVAQSAHFTVPSGPRLDQEALIDHACEQSGRSDVTRQKMVVPADQKPTFLRQLRLMHVTAGSLFPGPDGLGRATRELAMLALSETAKESAS